MSETDNPAPGAGAAGGRTPYRARATWRRAGATSSMLAGARRVGLPDLRARARRIVQGGGVGQKMKRRLRLVARDRRIYEAAKGPGLALRPVRRPPEPQRHLAQVVAPGHAVGGARVPLDLRHGGAGQVLGATVVAGEGVERLGEPPHALLERAALVTGEPAIAPRGGSIEQRCDIGP